MFLLNDSDFATRPPYGDVIHFNHVTLSTLCEHFRILSLGELYRFVFRFGNDHDTGGYSEKVGKFFVSGIDAEEFRHSLLYEAHREFYINWLIILCSFNRCKFLSPLGRIRRAQLLHP